MSYFPYWGLSEVSFRITVGGLAWQEIGPNQKTAHVGRLV